DVSYCPLGDLLGKSDIVSLHCPLNSKTEGMIGSDEMAVMKPGSIIINTSRGPLINEDALVKNLYAGHLKGAGLDVYATEPLPGNSPLLSLQNVVLTPHIGGITLESFRKMMREAFQNIEYFHNKSYDKIEVKKIKY